MFDIHVPEGDPAMRIAQMLDQVLYLIPRQPQAAWSLAQDALARALQSPQPALLARTYYLQGQCLLILGDLSTAQARFDGAKEQFAALNDSLSVTSPS